MPTYSARVSVQQGTPINIEIGSQEQLPANFNAGLFSSTYGRKMQLQQEYSTAPDTTSAGVNLTNPATIITVDRTAMDNTFSNFGIVAIGGDIFALSASSNPVAGTVQIDCAKTPMPLSGAAVETRYAPSVVMSSALYTQNLPPMPILNSAGTLCAMVAYDGTISGAASGQTYLIDTSTMTLSVEAKFEGLDATTAGNSILGWKPKDDATGNFGLWSGVYLGTNTRPILVDANLDGTENGRFNISLSDPIWDSVLNQPVATASMRQILPCNAGWFAALGADVVNPAAFIVWNEDMTKYWVYVMIFTDSGASDAVNTGFWGLTSSERIFVDAPPPDETTAAGALLILGAVGNPSLLLQNSQIFAPLPRILLPPYPAIYSAPCVPCAPLLISGDTWQGRLA